MIFSIDASDVLLTFDYKLIAKKINDEKIQRFRYKQVYGGAELEIARIYNKKTDSWEGCIHEILTMNYDKKLEYVCNDTILKVKHDNDKVVVRNYIGGLAFDIIKYPNNPRWYYYL